MNFQQLRIIRETVRCGFNLTEVAERLHTSQSGVSKHIKDLEDELGLEFYVRHGKRLLGLTEPGREVARIVERMLLDAHNIRTVADQYSLQDAGELTVATTHTQARYVLPRVVAQFRQHYPKVHLRLHQGSPREIARMLQEGSADIGIATEVLAQETALASFPYHNWRHALVLPDGHPLAAETELTLEAIAAHPIITYHEGFTGRAQIERVFNQVGAVPDIVMSAMDADVIKSYVRLGLGAGIIASIAYEPELDVGLILRRCDSLFDINVTHIAIRRGHLLRSYAYAFMQLCSPELTRERVISEEPSGVELLVTL